MLLWQVSEKVLEGSRRGRKVILGILEMTK